LSSPSYRPKSADYELRHSYRGCNATGGIYVGGILKGAKVANSPVAQSSKFELIFNVQTITMLGLAIPPTLLATADEVIQ